VPNVTTLQKIFLAYVALQKQRMETLKVIALCRASLAGANLETGSSALFEGAQKALMQYVKHAEHLIEEEGRTENQLQKILEQEAAKTYVIGTAETPYKTERNNGGDANYGRTLLRTGT